MIYMCADNNLESAALNDIYEMETSRLNTDKVNVLFLLDKTSAYNSGFGDFSGTKLFKLKTGRAESEVNMISTELDCQKLGLKTGTETELDMSDETTLANFVSYCMQKFPSQNNALIMWGHGSGWKSADNDVNETCKGFAQDDSSDSVMSLRQFGSALKTALKELKLDFIGFDTCFGSELEVLYEIRNYADYCCGSEGLVSSSGWNYRKLFSDFSKTEELTTLDFMNCCLNQFKNEYKGTSRASFSVVNLNYAQSYFSVFDDFMLSVADQIINEDTRDLVFDEIYNSKNCKTQKYTYGKSGYDVYLDCYSLCSALNNIFDINAYNNFIEADRQFVILKWASDTEVCGPGIYFQTLGAGGLINTAFDSRYISGKTYNQIDFVTDSLGYVPSGNLRGSFLDKLFYWEY
ncbi:MAG: clostripain-related cysteine peptidase [Treponema sp.]|nr:clostripain-related cysteine peptidase [Treponema sp.]